MRPDEAKRLLRLHALDAPELTDRKQSSGFLGSLRQYRGRLDPDNFHEVMACLRALVPLFEIEELEMDRQVLSSLWGICHLARAWGVQSDGMLRRNRLITARDVATLDEWLECISYATMMLLDGAGEEEAFAPYQELCSGFSTFDEFDPLAALTDSSPRADSDCET